MLTEPGHMGKTYTLTGPEALSNAEIAQLLTKVLGREIRFVNLPPEQLKQAILAAGLPEWTTDSILDLQRLYREGKAASVSDDVNRILGRNPTNYTEFLQDHKSSFQVGEQVAS